MLKQGLELVIARNNFYCKNYRSSVVNFLLLLMSIIVFCAYIYFMHITIVYARYFPTNPAGEYIFMPPLSENHLQLDNYNFSADGTLLEYPSINIRDLNLDSSDPLVGYWAKQAIVALYDYDYVNYRGALQGVRDYFTLNGHAEFLVALNFSRNLEAVKNNAQIVQAKITGDPVISSGIYGDTFAWQVEFPVDVIYENALDKPLIQKVVASLLIVRETTLRSPFFGLAIEKINLKVI